jgi:hypothetical protein
LSIWEFLSRIDAMALVVPGVATNYPSPLIALASTFGTAPKEGQYQIPVEIDWGVMGGTDYLVSFNLANSGNTKQITQICAVHVDNSACGSDIQFAFTDTSETITIPAYEPYALVPVFSRSLQFFVSAGIEGEEVETTDVTRFTLFNFVPPPVVITPSQEQDTSVAAAIAGAVGNTQIVPAGTNGSLNVVYVNYSSPFGGLAGAGVMGLSLVDGTGKVLWVGQMGGGILSAWNVVLASLTGIDFRFQNGIKFEQTLVGGAAIAGNFNVVLGYRQP